MGSAPASKHEAETQVITCEVGNNVGSCKTSGATPLYWAAEKQDTDMIRTLLENGSDPDMRNGKGDTALHVVVKKSVFDVAHSEEIVRLLLVYGADVNARDGLGRTALHYVVDSDDVRFRTILTELLIWGGSLFTLDENGLSLLDTLLSPQCKSQPFRELQKALVEYIIALRCADLDCSEYDVVESTLKFEYFLPPNVAKHQIERIKMIKCGSYSLYDVFAKYNDPLFVLSRDVKHWVETAHFQVDLLDYGSLLRARFVSARRRYEMMAATHNKLTNELPNEVVWKILTFVRDSDLESIAKAING